MREHENAPGNHPLPKLEVPLVVISPSIPMTVHPTLKKVEDVNRAKAGHLAWQFSVRNDLCQARAKRLTESVEALMRGRLLQNSNRGEAGGRGNRGSIEGPTERDRPSARAE